MTGAVAAWGSTAVASAKMPHLDHMAEEGAVLAIGSKWDGRIVFRWHIQPSQKEG